MNDMRGFAVFGSVAACAMVGFALSCSPFSGSDSSIAGDAAFLGDGPGSAGSSDASADVATAPIDFDSCAGGLHVNQPFDGLTQLPPKGWDDGSYGGGLLSLETTQKLGTASMKATVVDTKASGVGAVIAFAVPGSITPAALRVRFAYKPVPATGDFYAELGCNIQVAGNGPNDAYLAHNVDSTSVVGFADTASTLPFSIFEDGWYHVTQEMHLLPADGGSNITLVSAVTPADGGVVTNTTNVTDAGALGPYQILCGIPYARPGESAMPTLDLYIDDIFVDICP